MLFLIATVVTINLMGIFNTLSSIIAPTWIQLIGYNNHFKLVCLKKMLKDSAMRRMGYYDGVQAVYLHVPGRGRTEITKEVKKADAAGGEFFTSANYIFHPLKLPENATVEVHGTNKSGLPYRFVFFSDSHLFVPLHRNYRPFASKGLISVEARFLEKVRDVTDLARTWTSCDVELGDVLPYIARDLFQIDDDLSTAVLQASGNERLEIHAMYSDLTMEKLETDARPNKNNLDK